MAQVLNGVLVERNGVSKTAAGWILGTGEKAVFRGVSARDGRMGEAGKDRELIPECFQEIDQSSKTEKGTPPPFLIEKNIIPDRTVNI